MPSVAHVSITLGAVVLDYRLIVMESVSVSNDVTGVVSLIVGRTWT